MDVYNAINEFNSNTSFNYKYEIENLLSFLRNRMNWSYDMPKILFGILTEDILQSLDYVIDHAHYTSRSMARKYRGAISELFLFLIRTNTIQNSDFYSELVATSLESFSYKYRLNMYIAEDERLKESEDSVIFSQDEIDELIEQCNYVFEKPNGLAHYSEMAACICIKLMIYIGLKYEAAYPLSFNSYSDGTLKINGYKVYLPNKLRKQFDTYIDELKHTMGAIPDRLFIKRDGSPWGKKTTESPITYMVKKFLGTTTTLGISKYGISKMIDADVSDAVISTITAAKEKLIRDCAKDKTSIDKEKYINSHIIKLDTFYTL